MPWNIKRKYKSCKGFAVVNQYGEIVGCHQTQQEAVAQQRALYSSEPDASKFWGGAFMNKYFRKR